MCGQMCFVERKKIIKAYGVNAETIVGKLIIGEQLGIYNKNSNLKFDDNGLEVSNNKVIVSINPNDQSIFNIQSNKEDVFSFDEDGNLMIVGDITAKSLKLAEGVKISQDNIDTTTFASVAVTGNYDDLKNKPQLSTIATSGKYSDLIDAPELSDVSISGSYNDLIDIPEIQETIVSNGSLPVCGKAVYDFALSKKQDTSNAEKLLYIDKNGNVTSISVNELKTLLNI